MLGAMPDRLPDAARVLGPAGLLPFAGLAALAALGEPWAPFALLAYGASILAFLGAVHWGFALADGEAAWGRMGLGVVPSLIAWVALLLPEGAGLVLVALALLGTAAVETWAAGAGLVPAAYLRLRWMLSIGAAASCLAGAGFS
jgi:hypothetical protein